MLDEPAAMDVVPFDASPESENALELNATPYEVETVELVGLLIVALIVNVEPFDAFCVLVGVPEIVSVLGEITRRMPVDDDLEPGLVWNVVCT